MSPAKKTTKKKGTKKKPTNLGGRPTKYNPAYNEQTYKLCLLGYTDAELADFFKISEATLNTWKQKHPKFLESIINGKDIADADVAQKMFHRATGYSHEALHFTSHEGIVTETEYIKHYPPDTKAAIHWLNNRQPNKFRNKQDHELTGKDGDPLMPSKIEIVIGGGSDAKEKAS